MVTPKDFNAVNKCSSSLTEMRIVINCSNPHSIPEFQIAFVLTTLNFFIRLAIYEPLYSTSTKLIFVTLLQGNIVTNLKFLDRN